MQDPSIRPGDAARGHATCSRTRTTPGATSTAEEARTDVVVENDYTFPMVTHFPIEPGGTVVVPTDQGGLDVYSPVQHPYLLQRTIASVIGLPLNQVRVFAPDPGGGFGGKQNPKLEPLMAFLALRTRRACRLVLSLEETFQACGGPAAGSPPAPASPADGELTFHRGATPTSRSAPTPTSRPARHGQGQLRRGRAVPHPRRCASPPAPS